MIKNFSALFLTAAVFASEGELQGVPPQPAVVSVPQDSAVTAAPKDSVVTVPIETPAPVIVTKVKPAEVSIEAEPEKNLLKPKGSPENRMNYVIPETFLSTYVGLSFPLSNLDEWGDFPDRWRYMLATPLIVAPLAFGTHLWISRRYEFQESHTKGTTQNSVLALYCATALPIAFTENWRDGYKVGTWLGAIAYPLGIWYGYHLGDVYRNNPSMLDTKFGFAFGYGLLGMGTPFLFYDNIEDSRTQTLKAVKFGVGQSVAMAVMGHFIADFSRSGPNVPGGVPVGITTHAVLAGAVGFHIALVAEYSNWRSWVGSAVLGTAIGATEGIFFFRNSQDSRERGLFSFLGAGGGALMGAGLQLVFNNGVGPNGKMQAWSSSVLIGAFLGYSVTYLMTRGMVDEPRKGEREDNSSSRWAINPIPTPEPVLSMGNLETRWRLGSLTYRF